MLLPNSLEEADQIVRINSRRCFLADEDLQMDFEFLPSIRR